MALVACSNPSQVDDQRAESCYWCCHCETVAGSKKHNDGRSTPGDDEVDPDQVVDICREIKTKKCSSQGITMESQTWLECNINHARLYQTPSPECISRSVQEHLTRAWGFPVHPHTSEVSRVQLHFQTQSWMSRGTRHRCCTRGAHRKYFLGLTVSTSQKEELVSKCGINWLLSNETQGRAMTKDVFLL